MPLAYFITLRTYGTWLHGDERGSVDATHNRYQTPLVAPDVKRHRLMQYHMRHEPYLLAADSATLVEQTVTEVAAHRRWRLHIVKARTNHVHMVAGGPVTAERMMNDFKAWATRRLREHGYARPDQPVWTEHGSTPHLFADEQLHGAVAYVRNWQGGPLQKTWAEVQMGMKQAASASAPKRAASTNVAPRRRPQTPP
jgi:hypothetical protein